MNTSYAEYINGANNSLRLLLSDTKIDSEEKKICIDSLVETLFNHIFNFDSIISYEQIFKTASLQHIDSFLNGIVNSEITKEKLDAIDVVCKRQKENIRFCSENNLPIPNIIIADIDDYYNNILSAFSKRELEEKHRSYQNAKSVEDFLVLLFDYEGLEILNDPDLIRAYIAEFFPRQKKEQSAIKYALNKGLSHVLYDAIIDDSILSENEINKIIDLLSLDSWLSDEAIDYVLNTFINAIKKSKLSITVHDIPPKTRTSVTAYSIPSQTSESVSNSDVPLKQDDYKQTNTSEKNAKLEKNNISQSQTEIKDNTYTIAQLHESMVILDLDIKNLDAQWQTNNSYLDVAIDKCNQMQDLITTFNMNKWKFPNIACKNPSAYIQKYNLYKQMLSNDRNIGLLAKSADRSSYSALKKCCSAQNRCISTCIKYKWDIPVLSYPVNTVLSEVKAKRAQSRRRNFIILMIALVILFYVGLMIWLSATSSKAKIEYEKSLVTFDNNINDLVGMNYSDVVDELEDMGFENIEVIESKSGYWESGKVLKITVNDSEVNRGTKYSVKDDFKVYCASLDRINITNIVDGWGTHDYLVIAQKLKNNGLKVSYKEIKSNDISKNGKIASVLIGGKSYDSGLCFIAPGGPVDMEFYGEAIKIDFDPYEWIDNKDFDYLDARKHLRELGFENIEFYRVDDVKFLSDKTEKSIEDIVINADSFEEGDTFYYKEKVRVYVHTKKDGDYTFIHDD